MEIRKTLASVRELVPHAITSILKEISLRESLSEDDEYDFRLILEEALINAIQHGNDFNTGLKVKTKIVLENDLLTITVSDEGKGFDYNALPSPLEGNAKLEKSGRGIMLIKKISDEIRFNKTGSEITIIKKLKKVNKNK